MHCDPSGGLPFSREQLSGWIHTSYEHVYKVTDILIISPDVTIETTAFGHIDVNVGDRVFEANSGSSDEMRGHRSGVLYRSYSSLDTGWPNHTLEATGYRAALRLLV